MNKKAYIDWLNNQIETLKSAREYSVTERVTTIDVELNVYLICLNKIKGR
jgi:hypothetical protein